MQKIYKKIIGVAILLGAFCLLMFFLNTDLFHPKEKAAASFPTDLPLSRCTVEFDADVLEEAVQATDWAELDGNTLRAKSDNGKLFSDRINQNGLAAALAQQYPDFSWDPDKPAFKMPKEKGYLTVPTWILFTFLDNYEDSTKH
jgi:hypothetical protein